jgi:hypothetical protein
MNNTLKKLLCSLLLLCGLSLPSAAQNPVPSTATYEDHGDYAINLVDLSIVLKTTARTKSGLIPFAATGAVAANHFTLDGAPYPYPLTPSLTVGMLGNTVSPTTSTMTCPIILPLLGMMGGTFHRIMGISCT